MTHGPLPPDDAFAATLPTLERRLARRLEGFGDIVFGFAVSQCALQLPIAHGHVDLEHPLALLFYFGTFALLASLWLTYHRLLSGTYRPSSVDLVLAFAYLALVTLMPFAMYSVSHQTATLEDARAALAEYATLFAALMAIAAVIGMRNLRRGWWFIDVDERTATWCAFLRRCALCAIMSLAVTVDLIFGPTWTTPVFFLIPIVLRSLRMFNKRPPPEHRLGIGPAPAAPVPTSATAPA